MTTAESFDRAIEASHQALDEIAKGNPSAFFELYSDRDDATLANPYGPPARGRPQIEEAGRRAAANYRDGRAIEFENFAKCLTADLGYVLEIERFEAKVAGSDEVTPVALRVTSIFCREDGTWKLLHRHADPINRPAGRVGHSALTRSPGTSHAHPDVRFCFARWLSGKRVPSGGPRRLLACPRTSSDVCVSRHF